MLRKNLIPTIALAWSVSLLTLNAYADTPFNTVNDGQIIQGGTYFNTPDNMTTFMNSAKTGLWLQGNSNLRGLEVSSSGNLTNNGGAFLFNAPGQVVRLDGDINVHGLQNGSGAYIGNGGKVFVNSAYLFQNGNIFANGLNGGLVQFDVGAATLGNGAMIMANGYGGNGGVVAINASGPVDLGKQSLISATGKTQGTLDSNVISIEGSLINVSGTLNADGVNSRGGTIRLVSSGQTNLSPTQTAIAQAKDGNLFTTQEASDINSQLSNLATTMDGNVHVAGADGANPRAIVSASGTGTELISGNNPTNPSIRAADGGTIIITAKRNIDNEGLIIANGASGNPPLASDPRALVNGGDGGTISLNAGNNISNTGRLVSDGGDGGLFTDYRNGLSGGNGGLVAMNYKTMANRGVIRAMGGNSMRSTPNSFILFDSQAHGGQGGLVVFSGDGNATGNGIVATFGGVPVMNGVVGTYGYYGKLGTIVTPNPTTASNQLFGAWRTTQATELLTHAENLLLLTHNGSNGTPAVNLFDRMLDAQKRSVLDPTGSLGNVEAEIISKNSSGPIYHYQFRNLVLSSTRDGLALNMTHPFMGGGGGMPGELSRPSPLSNNVAFSGLNSLNILNKGDVTTQYLPGGYSDSRYQPTSLWVIGRNSNPMGGGHISAITGGSFQNLNVLGTTGLNSGGSIDIAADGNVTNSALMTTGSNVHGGSILLKAGNDIINDEQPYYSNGNMSANGGIIGGKIGIFPQHDFNYMNNAFAGTPTSITANGSLQGGSLEVNAGHDILINIHPLLGGISAKNTTPTGNPGFVSLSAGNLVNVSAVIDTDGTANGTATHIGPGFWP